MRLDSCRARRDNRLDDEAACSYPHEFFMVYSEAEPTRLLAVWGGDQDEDLQACRLD